MGRFLEKNIGQEPDAGDGKIADPSKKLHPNIVWILAEDICPDLSCYGTPAVKTPNLDRLAAQGVRFTGAFTTAPVCSAARSAMMTGMYQTSIGAHQHDTMVRKPLPPGVKPITHFLKEAGYLTALGCGYGKKTHLNFTCDQLFDAQDWKDRQSDQPFFAQITLGVTHRAFRRDPNHPVDPAKVSIPPYYPDTPLVRRDWADYLESIQIMDREVGQILQRLDEEGIADNTVVIFIGDHGRCHVRGKEFLYDGGIHIPLIIRWPNHLKPGTVNDDLVSSIDISAEILNIAGVPVPAHMEGRAFLPSNSTKRDYIVSARDRCGSTYDRMRCIRTKDYKYIRNFFPQLPYVVMSNNYKRMRYPIQTLMQVMYAEGTLTPEQSQFMAPVKPSEELYDLKNDPHELHNLANDPKHQKVLIEQRARLESWIKNTGDKGAEPEDPKIAAEYHKRFYKGFTSMMKRRGLDPECTPMKYLKWWEKHLGVKQK